MKILIFFTFFFISQFAFTQTAETIQTGRPGQSIGAGVVGTNIFQIQSGVESNKFKLDGYETDNVYINNIARYGLNEKYELSAVLDVNQLNTSEKDLGNFQFGGRVSLVEKSKGLIPKLCFQTRLQIIDGAGEQNDDLKLVSIISGVYNLKSYGSLTSNINFNNVGRDNYELVGYTASWSQSYDENLSYFFEFYSSQTDQVWEKFWDTGIGYLIHKDFAVDLSIGTDLEDAYDSHFVNVGFSWRKL